MTDETRGPYQPSQQQVNERLMMIRAAGPRYVRSSEARSSFMIGWISTTMDRLDKRDDPWSVREAITDVRALLAADKILQQEAKQTAQHNQP